MSKGKHQQITEATIFVHGNEEISVDDQLVSKAIKITDPTRGANDTIAITVEQTSGGKKLVK